MGNDYVDIDKLGEAALKELEAYGEVLIKKMDEKKSASPIGSKNNPHKMTLPQPMALLACSGLLEMIEKRYLGVYEPGAVFIVYAKIVSLESQENSEEYQSMVRLHNNAVIFGTFQDYSINEGYIGFIKVGEQVIINKTKYVKVIGAEMLDQPVDVLPSDFSSCKTHIVKHRNISLDNGVVKIPICESAWETIESEQFIAFYWERKFDGLLCTPERYEYLFYSDKKQKCYKFFNLKKEGDEFELENDDVFIYRAEAQDSTLYLCFDLSKLKEVPVKKSSFDILQKKEWTLDWNCVKFKTGYMVVFPPDDGSVKFKPLAVSAAGVLESFNYLKEYLNDRLQPVHCSVEAMKLTIYDTIRFNEAIEKFSSISRQKAITVSEATKKERVTPAKLSFNQALSKARKKTPEDFKKYKSKYIDYLVSKQSDKYKVIPCVERLAHMTGDTTEYAFMFSIECPQNKVLIVHENVNPDRSTLLFLVEGNSYDKTIRSIYDFFQSALINKRSGIRVGDVECKDGLISYKSINHDDIISWQTTIKSYINELRTCLPHKEHNLMKTNFLSLSSLLKVLQTIDNFDKVKPIFERYNLPITRRATPSDIMDRIPESCYRIDNNGNKVLPIPEGAWSLEKLIKLFEEK